MHYSCTRMATVLRQRVNSRMLVRPTVAGTQDSDVCFRTMRTPYQRQTTARHDVRGDIRIFVTWFTLISGHSWRRVLYVFDFYTSLSCCLAHCVYAGCPYLYENSAAGTNQHWPT